MTPTTTFQNRYVNGTPRPMIGYWRPSLSDAQFILAGYDPALAYPIYEVTGNIQGGGFDAPIYSVKPSEKDFHETHCAVTGREYCPAIPWDQHGFPHFREVVERHSRCPRESLSQLEAWATEQEQHVLDQRLWRLERDADLFTELVTPRQIYQRVYGNPVEVTPEQLTGLNERLTRPLTPSFRPTRTQGAWSCLALAVILASLTALSLIMGWETLAVIQGFLAGVSLSNFVFLHASK